VGWSGGVIAKRSAYRRGIKKRCTCPNVYFFRVVLTFMYRCGLCDCLPSMMQSLCADDGSGIQPKSTQLQNRDFKNNGTVEL
jgi:uncharacterized protein (DUF983 family)